MKFKKLDGIIYIAITIIIIFNILKPKSYESNYIINDFQVKESYINNTKEYNFSISKDNDTFYYQTNSKYNLFHNIIKNIEYLEDETSKCIIPKSNSINTIPLCKSNNEYIDYRLIKSNISNSLNIESSTPKIINTTNNINIYDNSYNYLIWDYKSFLSITPESNKKIDLFNKDIYNPSLISIVENYLLIPNYEQEYNYNEFIIINLNNDKKETWKINYDISDNSYILGTDDKSIFIVDRKNKIEYELVPSRKKIRIIGTSNKDGKILNNTWENISMNKLIQEKLSFYNKTNYEILNDKLYLKMHDTLTLLSNRTIKKIIYQKGNIIYYISDDTLYSYEPLQGEKTLLQSFEWNFNYDNLIYIY